MAVPLTGRRRFVQLMGWASVVAMARGGPALAAAAAKTRLKSAPPRSSPPPDTTAAAAKPPEISDEARALAEVVKQRYGAQLGGDDLQTITRDLDGDIRAMKRLGEVKLANADEPDLTFHA